ncbi:MAG: hypothetical protein V2A54_09720 [Bacteroidota bacterium]
MNRIVYSVCISLLFLFSFSDANAKKEKEPSVIQYNCKYYNPDVDTLPAYSGTSEDMYQFILQNIIVTMGVKQALGRAALYIPYFVVEPDGSIDNINFYSGDFVILEKELTRIIQKMPPWRPAKRKYRAVPFTIYLPLNFCMNSFNNIEIRNIGVLHNTGKKKRNNFLRALVAFTITMLFAKFVFFKN